MRLLVTMAVSAMLLCSAASVSAQQQKPAVEANRETARLVVLDLWYLTIADSDDNLRGRFSRTYGGESEDGPLLNRQQLETHLAEMQKKGGISQLHHFQTSTITGQKATIQIGQRRPSVTGIARSRGGTTRQIQYMEVGTIVQANISSLENDQLRIQLQFESSSLEDSDVHTFESPDGESSSPATTVDRFTSQSVVDVAPGRPRLVAATGASDADQSKRSVLVICASEVGQ